MNYLPLLDNGGGVILMVGVAFYLLLVFVLSSGSKEKE